MTLSALKKLFFEELKNSTEETEINTFYFWLVEEYLGLKRVDISLNPDKLLTESEENRFKQALNRLKKQEPLQYVLGTTEFFGLSFQVDKNVLIPRPETEQLVAWILEDGANTSAVGENEPIKILDMGTGSGCIAIALAKNWSNTRIYGLDVSKTALEVAKMNAQQNDAAVHFMQHDILNLKDLEQDFDIIVSNPPYVRELEKAEIKANVMNFEPEQALFVSDKDPLIFYRKITDFAEKNLKMGGKLYFEINEYLAEEIENEVAGFNFGNIKLRKDYFGKPRMLKAIKR